ncbi:hypothetical protein HK105_207513 [Polyrhizophydium stewartii]|uniref:Protein kinase domain-containing protein n=1 Tax=Polyrhizophydium stewartii TaxID=2732419 RepID=A0ABR4N0A7_9FUNG
MAESLYTWTYFWVEAIRRFLPEDVEWGPRNIADWFCQACIAVQRLGRSIYLPIKLRCTDLINENADFVAFARDLSNSSSVLYKKINHVLAYAVKARCRFGMLTSGDSTHFFELVHIEGGGIGVFVMDRALTWHQCDTPATPSIRAIFAGMVFELYDMLEFEFKHDSRSVVTGVIIGGTPPASAASSRGTASIQDTEDLQLPASPASHTDIDSEPQAQGPAADADMANSDTAVQQPNSPCKPLQSRFPVIWCNRGGDNFAEEGLKILRQDPEWGPQADGVAHLVIGECIGRGRSASGFAGSLGGESVVIKLLPIDRLDRFFLELRNYERLAKLQGGAIAKLHFAFTFEAYSLGLVVERGKVEIPPRPEDKQLALDALKQIHACGAVHGDAHLGNLAFVGTGESRRAFWFDLERTTFPTKNLQWSQKVDIARFERRWEKGLEGRTSWS